VGTCRPDMQDSCECIVKSISGQPTRGDPTASGLGVRLTTFHHKKTACYEMLHRTSELAGSYERVNESSGSIKGGEFLD
jgi:hypothetical protein